MLGLLLGGLMGGAMRRGGGGGGSSMPTYSARAPQAAPMAPEPQEGSGQTRAQKPQQAPDQQPPEQPMVQQAAKEVATAQPAPQQQPKSPISGLMDDPKPQAQQPQTDQPEPPSFVNKTPTPNPVARQQDETLGQIPQLNKPEGIANQLLDSGTNRQRMEFQSGMPDKHFDTGGSDWTPPLGLSYQQPTTVAGSVPARKYRV